MLRSVGQKVIIQLQREVLTPKSPSLVVSLEGMTVLNAELKSTNNIRTYVLLLFKCVSTECSTVHTASSVLLVLR